LFLGLGGTGGLALAVLAHARRGPHLQGVLAPLRIPDSGLAGGGWLSYDLGRNGARRFVLGRRGRGLWRLPGWNGSALFTADATGAVRLAPGVESRNLAGAVGDSVLVNGQPIGYATTLHDGDIITCGEYEFRYENLLS
jgi:hypothetical protein